MHKRTITEVTYPCSHHDKGPNGTVMHAMHEYTSGGPGPDLYHSSNAPKKAESRSELLSVAGVITSSLNASSCVGGVLMHHIQSGSRGSSNATHAEVATGTTNTGSVRQPGRTAACEPTKFLIEGSRKRGGSGGDFASVAEGVPGDAAADSTAACVPNGIRTDGCESVVPNTTGLESDGSPVRSCVSEPPSVRLLFVLGRRLLHCF